MTAVSNQFFSEISCRNINETNNKSMIRIKCDIFFKTCCTGLAIMSDLQTLWLAIKKMCVAITSLIGEFVETFV